MTRILCISGSFHAGSFTALSSAARHHAHDSIPICDGDFETATCVLGEMNALKVQILASEGLLLSTSEYKNSMPAGPKKSIDWLSQSASGISELFGRRPLALMRSVAQRFRHAVFADCVADGDEIARRAPLGRPQPNAVAPGARSGSDGKIIDAVAFRNIC